MTFNNIVPYDGLGEIKLYTKLDDVKEYLDKNHIKYEENIYDHSDCDVKYNWYVLKVDNSIGLFFSEGNYKLFKIYIMNKCEAKLPNNIKIGTAIKYVKKIDDTLVYEDFEEIYLSSKGYWIEDDPLTNDLFSIQVFVKEIDDEDFFLCKW